ncbi:MAG TPA: gliding motility protein GldM [Flavobacteriia bacterium]|nr:gliding motility protein GldM [Flavobacteriia bacterium]
MAGGKLSARQKMINLMYLVFIAMLAMQMGKKVLSAFGRMNETFEETVTSTTQANENAIKQLQALAQEQPEKYTPILNAASALHQKSTEFNNYLASLKDEMLAKSEDKKNYEAMSSSNYVDEMFFKDGKETAKGKEFVNKVTSYREDVLKLLDPKKDADLIKKVKKWFDTSPDKHGKKGKREEPWLASRFEGFPLISSVSNISKMQTDVAATEKTYMDSSISGQRKSDVSMTNYDAMVVFDKNAYYPGEKLSGKIILGKNDPTIKAKEVIINGNKVKEDQIKAGQVILSGSAGNVGEHELKGKFIFLEDGKPVEIPIVGGKYSVIPKPNEAIISADKMNVVYRGVANPLSISVPGVPDNKVKPSAPGLKQISAGKYVMNPPKAREVVIRVTAKLPNGQTVTSSKKFRVKDIPSPTGTIRGQDGYQKMSKSSLVKSTVGAVLKDFVFDLDLYVSEFKVKVPGKPTITCSGKKMSSQATRAINKAKRGDAIIIFDIKAKLKGNSSYRLKKTSQVTVEITS